MKACVIESVGKVAILEVPEPIPNEYQGLVKILACATCNSTDLKLIEGKMNASYPCILGHESVGEVMSVGARVKSFSVGDIVTRPCAVYPNEKLGEYYSAWGGYAQYGLVTDVQAMLEDGVSKEQINPYAFMHQTVPKTLTPVDATMLINFKETISVLNSLGVSRGDKVLIIGDGPVGASFAMFAHIRGAIPIVVGHHDERLAFAKEVGAEVVINSRKSEVTLKEPVDFIIDAVGAPDALASLYHFLRDGGTAAVYGVAPLGTAPPQVPHVKVSPDEPSAHDEVISLIETGAVNPAKFYSHVVNIDQLPQVFDAIKRREISKKVVVELW